MKKLRFLSFIIAIIGGLASLPAAAAAAAQDANGRRVIDEIKGFYAGIGNRLVGSPGNLAVEEKVAQRFAASGFASGAIRFTAPSFRPGETTLTLEGQQPIRLRPLHPTLVRPGNFRVKEFRAPLVYLGRGTYEDLENLLGTSLDGALALMEFDSGNKWHRFLRFGIRGFIFVGAPAYSRVDTEKKLYDSEVAVPRFFVDAADGARLKSAIVEATGPPTVRVQAEPSRWQNEVVRDLWVLIPGADADLERDVCVFMAPLDANGVVPELAIGAQSATNVYLLLEMLEAYRKEPPARSVLLVAVNAHTHSFNGERMLAWHLLAKTTVIEDVRNLMADEIRVQNLTFEYYQRLKLDSTTNKDDQKQLVEMRTYEDRSTGKYVTLKDPLVALSRRDLNRTKGRMIELQRLDMDAAKKAARQEELNATKEQYINVLTLFNKVGKLTLLSDLTDVELGILRGYVDEIVDRQRRWMALNRRDLEMNSSNDAIREALAGRRIAFLVSLDLTWTSPSIGFAVRNNDRGWPRPFGVNTTRIAQALAQSLNLGDDDPFVDTLTNYAGLSELHYFPLNAQSKIAAEIFHRTEFHAAFQLMNAYTDYGRAFTPTDTFANLDPAIVGRLIAYVPKLFAAIMADPMVAQSDELKIPPIRKTAWATQIKAFKFDEFAASILPELPVSDSFILLYPETNALSRRKQLLLWGADVIYPHFALTDDRASAMFYAIDDGDRIGFPKATNAFHLDEDFIAVDHIIDSGEVHFKVNSNITNRSSKVETRIFALFECREFPIYERNDPTDIEYKEITKHDILVIDGKRNSAPRQYGLTGINSAWTTKKLPATHTGPAAVYMPPHVSVKLLTDSKTSIINASPEEEDVKGIGFESPEALGRDPIRQAAEDMAVLNQHRLGRLRGVTDELVESYMERGSAALERLEAARLRQDHNGYLDAVYEAVGAEKKAYKQVSTITDDMLKAIVFYMALLLPFCFFVERLLFKTSRIEWQMATFAVLFIATFVLFRIIHPAFRVADAPEAILIAFVMGALGLFVISILYSRFEGEMQLLFQTYSGMDASEVGYSTVGQKAMLIGVNNMKRRRLRTALTTATIVLVTFTMLAFSSISRKMSPTVVPVTKSAPYTGVFFQWPGSLRMDEATLQVMLDMFKTRAERLIVRRWLVPKKIDLRDPIMPYRVSGPDGKSILVDAALGLEVNDYDFLAPQGMPLLPGGRWFSANDAREFILPAGTADALGITPAMIGKVQLDLLSYKFDVIGIVDNERFRALRDLNDKPILPIKDIQAQGFTGDLEETNLKIDPTTMDESSVFYADTSALVLMPIETARKLGALPFSISAKIAENAPVWPLMDSMLTVTRGKFFVGSRVPFGIGEGTDRKTTPGVYFIGTGYNTSIGGLARLIIPLLIAGTIILNTMLGSVFERKSEIAVYNAVGLNPTHIGMFFLAEAFVYSVIGSVGGYLIGQLISIGLAKFQLVSEINLNFSSLSVVYVIVFTIAVVLLSTLYPALVATRAAVPSGKRKWALPEHDGKEMNVAFPFIYHPRIASGIMSYLIEYFSRYTEASLGDLIASNETRSTGTDAAGRETYDLGYDVALAPYDLGVTQSVRFQAAFDEIVESYRVSMTITRESGQDTNWVTTNRPFLERLRRHMMHWRNLDAVAHATYVEQSVEMFG